MSDDERQIRAAARRARKDLAARVEELADKSSAGMLTPAETAEYNDIVRLNGRLSAVRLQQVEESE